MKSSKVIFKFDKEKDLQNIFYVLKKDKKYGLPFELSNLDKKDLFSRIKTIHSSKLFHLYRKNLQILWKEVEEPFFKKISKIFNQPIAHKKYEAYLTTMNRCPYFYQKNPWFMVSTFESPFATFMTIAHEIMHMQFHFYYGGEVREAIGEKKTYKLNEALTVIINEEFSEMFFTRQIDPSREKLRKFILKEWKKDKNFENLLNKCIAYLKN